MTSTVLTIQPLPKDDVQHAFTIHQSVQFQPWSLPVFEDCMTSPYQCWGVYQHNNLVGYAILLIVLDEVTLMDIAINPSVQGQGIGRYLLTEVLEQCRRQQLHSCFLEVRVSNQPAITLYQSLGFQLLETRKGYYPAQRGREDALMMSLAI